MYVKRSVRTLLVVIAAVLVSCLFIYLWGPRCAVREVAAEDRCRHGTHAVLLASAIQRYCQLHGGPPPPVFVGPNGHKHSWRVLLLPYFPTGEGAYRAYRFDEPWDSEHNRHALESFLQHGFHYCPQDRVAANDPFHTITSYTMLVRTQDASPDYSERVTAERAMVVESSECGIQFAEPRDVPWEDLWKGDSAWGVGKLYSAHDFAWVIRRNGGFLAIPMNLSPGQLRLILDGYLLPSGMRVVGDVR